LPREMLYQLAVYALSKTTAPSRSTVLYPTLAANAIDQVILLKDPALGHKRAELGLRPVDLLKMEGLIRPRQGGHLKEAARVFRSEKTAALNLSIAS
jgi:5-methylcytosine-specific restriction enzyme subunit McrC